MQPIADMPDDAFMKLQQLYAAELPICPVCTLEDARRVLSGYYSKLQTPMPIRMLCAV